MGLAAAIKLTSPCLQTVSSALWGEALKVRTGSLSANQCQTGWEFFAKRGALEGGEVMEARRIIAEVVRTDSFNADRDSTNEMPLKESICAALEHQA